MGLPAPEARLALLDEGAHALARVLAGEEEGELVGLELQAADEVYVLGSVRGGLRVADGEGAVRAYLGGEGARRRERLALADDPVDEAHTLRLLGVDAPAGEDQLLGERRAYEAREPLGAAHAGEDTEAHLREAEEGVLGGDPYVARNRDLAAAPEGEAVDGGYRRHGAAVEQGHRGVTDLREPLRLQRAHPAHRRDVRPRDKRPVARPRHEDRARLVRLDRKSVV